MNIYEKRIIGGIIKGVVLPSEIDLDSGDFESSEVAACMTHARQLQSEGKVIDSALICSRLDEHGFYTPDDFELMAAAVGSASIVWESVEKVKASALKTLILSETASIAIQDDKSAAELLDKVKAIVAKADDHYRSSENNFLFLSEIAPKVKAVYDDLQAGISYSVPTYFSQIDDLILDGFSRGDEHIIVGFTGSGKSALALACARQQAKKGICVGIVSREMSDIENVIRLQASDANIPRWQIRKPHGNFTLPHKKLVEHLEDFSNLPIAFDTRTSDVESLRPQVKRMVEGYGMQILYVDYLQLLSSKSNQSSRANEVQAISRTLKEIAMENKIPVVSLCQFNRGAAQASLFEILGYLKESSGIEQDASTILYIQIEKTEEKKEVKDAKLTVLKNRNGATFHSVDLRYRGETFTFTEDAHDTPGVYRGGS